MVDTRKFSEFSDSGVQVEGQTTVGLDAGANARFTTAPQFLPSGTTGDRPVPAVAGMIRYNTSLNNYEYYNGTVWTQFEDSVDIALLIARLAAHTAGDGASMIGLENQGTVTGQTVQNLAEADFIVKSVKDALVNAIALSDLSTGVLVNETGTGDLVAREIVGTVDQTTVVNGTGLAGNPRVAIADNPTLPGSTHVQIPFGTTAQRPPMPANGYFRYNTTLNELEYWNNNAMQWFQIENSGALLSVIGTANEIDVDNTDPVNPVLRLSSTLIAPGTAQVGNLRLDTNTISSLSDRILLEPALNETLRINVDRTVSAESVRIENLNTNGTNSVARLSLTTAPTTNAACITSYDINNDPITRWQSGSDINTLNGYYIGKGTYPESILPAGLCLLIDNSDLSVAIPNRIRLGAGGNLLNHYEEGTWTPAFTFAIPGNLSVSYVDQQGRYVRIGNCVYLFLRITFTPTHTTASGSARVTGLPFTPSSVIDNPYLGVIRHTETLSYPSGRTTAFFSATSGQTYLNIFALGSATSGTFLFATDVPSGQQQQWRTAICYLI